MRDASSVQRVAPHFPWGPALLALAFLLLTLPLRYGGIGEADAARLANDAILWRATGTFPVKSYLPWTSPAYLLALRGLLEAGLPPASLPFAMNLAAPFFGASAVLLGAMLLRRLLPWPAWGWAGTAFALMPGIFDESLYGMPHMPALVLILVSLLCADVWALKPGGSPRLLAGCALALAGAMAFKADVALAALAFPGLLLHRDERRTRAWAAMGAATLLGAALALGAPRLLAPRPETGLTFAGKALSGDWRPSLAKLRQPHNRDIPRAFGIGVSLAAGVGALVAFRRRGDRRLAVFLAAWALPSILFWSSAHNNSARHVFVAFVPGCAFAGLAIGALPRRWRAATAFAALLVNTFALPPQGSSTAPSGRLFAYRAHRAEAIGRVHAATRESADTSGGDLRVVLGTWSLPYAMFETLAAADSISIERDTPDPTVVPVIVTRRGGLAARTRFAYVSSPNEALAQVRSEEAHGHPFRAVSIEFAAPGIEVPGGGPLDAP